MNTIKMFAVAALLGLASTAHAVRMVGIDEWATDNNNSMGATALVDSDGSTTGRDDATKTSIRMGVVDMRRTTGDTSTSFTPSAFNETATRIIDTSTPVRGLMVHMTPRLGAATHFVDAEGGLGMVGLSIYGKTAANLRQGYLPVRIGTPLILNDIYWFETTGASVSMFVETNAANVNASVTFHVQVIR